MSLKIFYPRKYLSKLPAVLLAAALLVATPAHYLSANSVPYSLDQSGYLETVYDTSNGLGSSAANDVVQTPDGFIWVGTYNGLSKYDGSTFQHFPVSKGILLPPENNIIIAADNGGGINLLKNDEIIYTFNEEDGLKSGVILRLANDPQADCIWISTGNSIAYLKNGVLYNIDNFPSTNNFDFIFTPQNELLITCNQDHLF